MLARMSAAEPEEPARPQRGQTAAERDEPAQPERGRTAQERGPDTTAAEDEVAAATSTSARMLAAAKPNFLLSQADGYPTGIKQFLQFCLILIYPGWLFALAVMWPIAQIVTGVLWVLFSPLRWWMKRHHPEDYAASQRK